MPNESISLLEIESSTKTLVAGCDYETIVNSTENDEPIEGTTEKKIPERAVRSLNESISLLETETEPPSNKVAQANKSLLFLQKDIYSHIIENVSANVAEAWVKSCGITHASTGSGNKKILMKLIRY